MEIYKTVFGDLGKLFTKSEFLAYTVNQIRGNDFLKVKRTDYSEFNEALDKLMMTDSQSKSKCRNQKFNGKACDVFSEISYDNRKTYDKKTDEKVCEKIYEKGSVIIQVYIAGGAVPVMGAKVVVWGADNKFQAEDVTDISGKTKKFYLDVPPDKYSKSPSENIEELPYGLYNIRVEKIGFYTREFLNVAVFSGIESIQKVNLEPLDANATEEDLIVVNERQSDRSQRY